MNDLRRRAIRGGVAKVAAQGIGLPLRVGSLMVLARLLEPRDFGLVAMVTAVTGVFSLFKDFGLSTATVQRPAVTDDQMSTLFWINLLAGAVLCLVCVAGAPLIAAFYREPRLSPIMTFLAAGFVFNAAGVQHSVVLQRQMRFVALSIIDVAALLISVSTGVGLAVAGFGYWALVAMSIMLPLATTTGCWIAAAWIPGRPRRRAEIRSMIRFGGTLTLNSIVVYIGYNLEKVLLGRFWGAANIGLYGRAYQVITIPTENLNSAIGGVAFSALSRVQHDPERLRSYFLKGYSLVLALTIPLSFACILFADDLMLVVLGPKWTEAAAIFRLLAPTILIFALINPLGWLLFSLGLVDRSLKVALVLAPVVIAGYVLGLPYGPRGVAFGYSAMLTLWAVPHIWWCVHGTVISLRDIWRTVSRPLASSFIAAVFALALQISLGRNFSPLLRLCLEGSVMLAVYSIMLLGVMRQRAFYFSLVEGLRARPAEDRVGDVAVVTAIAHGHAG
jgi:O-antigen/teichoic acid export membrane protein